MKLASNRLSPWLQGAAAEAGVPNGAADDAAVTRPLPFTVMVECLKVPTLGLTVANAPVPVAPLSVKSPLTVTPDTVEPDAAYRAICPATPAVTPDPAQAKPESTMLPPASKRAQSPLVKAPRVVAKVVVLPERVPAVGGLAPPPRIGALTGIRPDDPSVEALLKKI